MGNDLRRGDRQHTLEREKKLISNKRTIVKAGPSKSSSHHQLDLSLRHGRVHGKSFQAPKRIKLE